MGSTVFRNPRALSSALAVLGTLQPRALGFLNTVDPLDTVSNCYVVYHCSVREREREREGGEGGRERERGGGREKERGGGSEGVREKEREEGERGS